MVRIGQSKDIHRLCIGRPLILGGVNIPYEKGLMGHSDADVLTHVIIEAIIGAMGLGDIGTHFPDTDDRYKGISSLLLLEETVRMMNERDYRIGNIDALIMIERPKMAPYLSQMKENLSVVLKCSPDRINLKATRGEGLGYIGEGLGVEAYCVCLLEEGRNHE